MYSHDEIVRTPTPATIPAPHTRMRKLTRLKRLLAALVHDGAQTRWRTSTRAYAQAEEEQVEAGAEAEEQFELGEMYYSGEGVAKDRAEAARLFRLAADQGMAQAQNVLGHMYYSGEGVVKHEVEAARLVQLAAGQGDVDAQ